MTGDVVGRDIVAAAGVGHLRSVLRAIAWDALGAHRHPSSILRRVDRLVLRLDLVPMATVAYARIGLRDDDGTRTLQYCGAGHPPFLLREPSGSARFLETAPTLPLGVDEEQRTPSVQALQPGSTLAAFTDGLVEQRDES